ncbi:MAG: HAD hydrolase-like protein [Aquificaceae bacterium]|nr:HAD hydrolase-like protein [Aquificaceae bacterium]
MEPHEALMVGDDIEFDVKGAQDAGIRGVLVKTGKFRPEDLKKGIEPFAILESVAELPRFLSSAGFL